MAATLHYLLRAFKSTDSSHGVQIIVNLLCAERLALRHPPSTRNHPVVVFMADLLHVPN